MISGEDTFLSGAEKRREKYRRQKSSAACGDQKGLTGFYTMLQVTPFSLKEAGALLLPFHEPLKPGLLVSVVPGARVPLYERFVTVTLAPDWVELPFQSCVIVCPLGKANVRLQPLIVVVPVFVIVIVTPKPSDHWFVTA